MRTYLTNNPITIPLGSGGAAIRTYMIGWVYRFHNHVRTSSGGIDYPFEELPALYEIGGHGACVEEASSLVNEIKEFWSDLPTREFRTAVAYLIGLIKGGPLL
jgi:hypothetical protein